MIRRRYQNQKILASLYGVTQSTISKIFAQSKEILAVHPLVAGKSEHAAPTHRKEREAT